MPPRSPAQPTLSIPPKTVAERAREDFAEQLARPCRMEIETGFVNWYLGWGRGDTGGVGHVLRALCADGSWGASFVVTAAFLRATIPTALPPGANPTEEPKK